MKIIAFLIICIGFILVFFALAKLMDLQDELHRRILALEYKLLAMKEDN